MHKIPKGTALAFDFGEARIGVAQAMRNWGCPIRWPPLPAAATMKNSRQSPSWFKNGSRVILSSDCSHADGTEHEMTHLSRKFGRRLNGRFNLPVYWVDERLSSVCAESLLSEAQVLGKNANRCSTAAAQAILHGFLEGGPAECFNGREG